MKPIGTIVTLFLGILGSAHCLRLGSPGSSRDLLEHDEEHPNNLGGKEEKEGGMQRHGDTDIDDNNGRILAIPTPGLPDALLDDHNNNYIMTIPWSWPHDVSDIALDPAVQAGTLSSNGMRYLMLSNGIPENHVQFQFHFDVGSNMESDDELGLAQMLRNMAFQTTRYFPSPGNQHDLFNTFQRLGVPLGSHLNAGTNFEETTYRVMLPNATDTDAIETTFRWFRSVADGMLFVEEELETERQIVISKLQERDKVIDRIWKRQLEWAVPNHLIAKRPKGGTIESVTKLQRQQFLDFYTKYYRPQRATLVVVGDVNLTHIQDLASQYLGDWEQSTDPIQEPDLGAVPVGQGLQTAVFSDNELQEYKLVLETVRTMQPEIDTVDKRIRDIHLRICNDIVTRRMQKISAQPNNTIYWGRAYIARKYSALEFVTLYVNPDPRDWTSSVATLEQEWRRARLYGFTQAEIYQSTAELLNRYEQANDSKDTRKTRDLTKKLVNSINDHRVVSTPQEDLLIASVAAETATPEKLLELFDSYWNTSDINLYLTTQNTTLSEEEAAATLESLFLQSLQIDVLPPPVEDNVTWSYTDFGVPGEVVSKSNITLEEEGLEYTQFVLSNNIRVNMKKTDLEAGRVRVNARFGSGRLSQPQDTPYLKEFSSYMIHWGGLGQHTWSEVDQVMAGKTVHASFGIESDSFVFRGNTNPDDLLEQLQLMTAHFADPGFRDEALQWFHDDIPGWRNTFDFTLRGVHNYDLFEWLVGGDARFAEPTDAQLYSYEMSDAKDWLLPQLNSSYLEISIVGDLMNETAAVQYVLQTFGALPQRANAKVKFSEDDRAVTIPKPPQNQTFTYKSKIPVAGTMLAWEIPSLYQENVTMTRRIQILTEIFRFRMFHFLRLELGGSYSPRAYTTRSRGLDYGFLFASVQGTPNEIESLGDAIIRLTKNMSSGDTGAIGISDDEISRAIRGEMSSAQENLASNKFWMNLMEKKNPVQVAELISIEADEIRSLAEEILRVDGALRLTIMPINETTGDVLFTPATDVAK